MFHPAESYLYRTGSTYSAALGSFWKGGGGFPSSQVAASWFSAHFLPQTTSTSIPIMRCTPAEHHTRAVMQLLAAPEKQRVTCAG